ncbi:MAG: hypothetical protein CM15mP105_2460 [Methanobacteriota archaeon]|nr:MAG: hypothetical protein CM15mP105_2460 [Euryarchaeota archaeon]
MRNHADVIEEFPAALVGKSYSPLFPGAIDRGSSESAWTVVSGLRYHHRWNRVVHTAVMYGEDDYRLEWRSDSQPSTQLVWMGLSFPESMRI